MVRKGQILFERKDRQLVFKLMPFAIGIYEYQGPRMDKEMAELFEEYFREAQGPIARYSPALQRVIPVEEAIPASVEVYPYERASALLEGAKAWAVLDCICRVQQRLVGKGCDRPVRSCMVFAPVEGAFDGDPNLEAISKERALQILREAEDAGLVHSPGNFQDGHHYI
jgi:hypothetical protein